MNTTKTDAKSNFGARGWLLVILGLLGSFITASASGSLNISSSVFSAMFGWSQTTLMLGTTFGNLVGAVLGIVGGRLFLKRSPRRAILICAVVYAVAFLLHPHSTQLWQFYLTLIIFMAAGFFWSFMCTSALVANWFPRKRGLVMGWITMGMPLGSGFTALMMSAINARAGFYACYYPCAILAIVTAILYMVCLRDFPSECGCYPDNDKSFDAAKMAEDEAMIRKIRAQSPWTAGRIFSTKEFWFIVLGVGFMMFSAGFMPQIVPTLTSYGFPAQFASLAMMGVCIIACFGSVILGIIDTKFGTKQAMIITYCFLIGMGLIAQIDALPAKLIAFVLCGLVNGAGSNFMLSFIIRIWGNASGMNIFRFAQPICTAITAFSSTVIAGVASAAGGNYNMSFLFIAILAVIGLILIRSVREENIKKKEATFTTNEVPPVK